MPPEEWQLFSLMTPESMQTRLLTAVFLFLYSPQMIIAKVTEMKRAEVIAGVDGFMVYDLKLVPYMNKVCCIY